MAKIRQLDPHVADLIAAGEVVERPASVVKELMENAIDAGAKQLTVEIQNGGMSLIRVTDNGSGIAPDEAELAFLRHATSKLSSARDLEAIETLGFRGEALAAIAAVSRVELLSRREGDALGVALLLDGGVLREREESGCPSGTTMLVRDLFFNTPARLKFMKRDSAEGAAVFGIVQRVALAHPELSVKFLRDGKQELLTPGDAKLSSALYSVFGRDLALGLTEVEAQSEEVTVRGFVSLPACCRGTRGYQYFILNGRPIRSPLLMAALEEAYKNQKMVGKFPACVLHVALRPSMVDVNVHPAKTEVKFVAERKLFDAVHYAVLSALDAQRWHPELELKPQDQPASVPITPLRPQAMAQGNLTLRDSAPGFLPGSVTAPTVLPVRQPMHAQPASLQTQLEQALTEPVVAVSGVLQTSLLSREKQEHPSDTSGLNAMQPMEKPSPEKSLPDLPEERPSIQEPTADWRMAGEVLDTYIIVEQGERIHLIDKHAAHERLHFDRMQAEDYVPMAQTLLEPMLLTLPPDEHAALLQNLTLLEDFGFHAESFGGGALIVRQLPSELSVLQAEETLSELAQAFTAGVRMTQKALLRDHILHTVACKAAIKAGQKNTPEELMVVVEAVMCGAVKYCPHGRPVAVTLTRAQLERRFGRA